MTIEKFPEGYIPSELQKMRNPEALSDAEKVTMNEVTWNPESVPPIIEYASLRDWLRERAKHNRKLFAAGKLRNWWDVWNENDVFVLSQGSSPSCAGFSLNRARMVCLMNAILQFSEQTIERENPGVTWAMSKGSVVGGQTMQAMAMAGNTLGSYPESATHPYQYADRYYTYSKLAAQASDAAAKRQISFAQVDTDKYDPAEEITLACQAGCGVMIGNCKAVESFEISDGKYEPVITTGGAHATAFGGYDFEREQSIWLNSWDGIYKTNLPITIGGPMSLDSTRRFCGGSYLDVLVVPYAESPADATLTPTLEVR